MNKKMQEFKSFLVKKIPFRNYWEWRQMADYKKDGRLAYRFSRNRYEGTFLDADLQDFRPQLIEPLRKEVFCFWTGNNNMSPNRIKGLQSLYIKTKVKVNLVTPNNLQNFILPANPLHPAFHYLSLEHKSDYLRCYFMHYYGGGYADIKSYNNSWRRAFRLLEKSDKYIIGYREIGQNAVAQCSEKVILEDLRHHFVLLIGNGAYICKPMTPFTYEWKSELDSRLDSYYQELVKFDNDKILYPIPYTNILGDVFHPLCLKYHKYILYSNNLKPSFINYK